MQLREYRDYDEYIKSQRRTDKIKNPRPCLVKAEVEKIGSYLRGSGIPADRIICHGARAGHEVDWFQDEFPTAMVVGTDLFLKGHQNVVQWDFHKALRSWKRYFDIVYSNALDHSYDPVKALGVWFGQLRPEGRLCVQWSQWHRVAKWGDCFGAEFHEYLWMLNKLGSVEDVLYHHRTFVTIIARRK
jgi:trans-aconitate methyltransferase